MASVPCWRKIERSRLIRCSAGFEDGNYGYRVTLACVLPQNCVLKTVMCEVFVV